MKTNKQEVNKRYGKGENKSNTKTELAKKSKIPKKVLDEVYSRGLGAYKTNPESVRLKGTYKKDPKAPLSKKLSKERWGMARVYSFINKIEGNKKLNHDKDLLEKIPKLKGRDLSRI
jgi:hypothetical protein